MALLLNTNDVVTRSYSYNYPSPTHNREVKGVGDYDTLTGMYKVPVVSRGKNLFDISQITGGGVANSTESIGTNYGYVSNEKYYSNYGVYGQGTILKGFYFDLKSGDQITISTDVLISENDLNPNEAIYLGIRKFDGSKNQQTSAGIAYHGEKIRLTKTLVVNDSGKYALALSAAGTSTQFMNLGTEFSNIQLELGSTATEYAPYRPPITTTQYLPTPLMANERLTPQSREVKWGKYVCTGNENLTLHQIFSDHASVRLALPSPNKSEVNGGYAMSTHLKAIGFVDLYSNGEVGVCVHRDIENSIAYIAYTNMKSVNDYKTWLKSEYDAGHPVTVWYQLATPTTEPVTTTPIGTLDGECWIDVDAKVRPPYAEVTYKTNTPQFFILDKSLLDNKEGLLK